MSFFEDLWLNGPELLSHDPNHWPEQKVEFDNNFEKAEEIKASNALHVTSARISRFSKYDTLVRSVGCVVRFCQNFRVCNDHSLKLSQRINGPLCVKDS